MADQEKMRLEMTMMAFGEYYQKIQAETEVFSSPVYKQIVDYLYEQEKALESRLSGEERAMFVEYKKLMWYHQYMTTIIQTHNILGYSNKFLASILNDLEKNQENKSAE